MTAQLMHMRRHTKMSPSKLVTGFGLAYLVYGVLATSLLIHGGGQWPEAALPGLALALVLVRFLVVPQAGVPTALRLTGVTLFVVGAVVLLAAGSLGMPAWVGAVVMTVGLGIPAVITGVLMLRQGSAAR